MKFITDFYKPDAGPFQPDRAHRYNDNPQYDVDQQFLAFLVGCIALGLPLVMIFGGTYGSCFRDSISHFYFSKLYGDVLVLALAAIGTFLVAYRGENPWESKLATIAGLSAFGVGLFPATGRGCEESAFSARVLVDLNAPARDFPVEVVPAHYVGEFFELFEYSGHLHNGSAAILFVFLAIYSFAIFPRVNKERHVRGGEVTAVKKTRNRIYIISGVVITISILALAVKSLFDRELWNHYNATFWFEALALWAFGVAWMVKGRFWGKYLVDEGERVAPKGAAA